MMATTGALTGFDGFPKATVAFLDGIRAQNDKAWFDAHRADYEDAFLAPVMALVAALLAARAVSARRRRHWMTQAPLRQSAFTPPHTSVQRTPAGGAHFPT